MDVSRLRPSPAPLDAIPVFLTFYTVRMALAPSLSIIQPARYSADGESVVFRCMRVHSFTDRATISVSLVRPLCVLVILLTGRTDCL